MTSVTPLAIQVAPTTASCSAQVRTWPVSLTAPEGVRRHVTVVRNQRVMGQGVLNVLCYVGRIGVVDDLDLVVDAADN